MSNLSKSLDKAIREENANPQGLPADIMAGMEQDIRSNPDKYPAVAALLAPEPGTNSDQDRTIENLCVTTMDVSKPARDGSVLATCGHTGTKYIIDLDGGYSEQVPSRLAKFSDQEIVVLEQALTLLKENTAETTDAFALSTLHKMVQEVQDEDMARFHAANPR